ncbi:GNAT family N-acetyltransferase [Deinococcus multiflagellatus]|uniref:GNAT family N-acetyltransferase n=1 Tax=Deinococcus multiflagellatus TaxID=1656887 RepID=A0ABW1ZL09_9DEIO
MTGPQVPGVARVDVGPVEAHEWDAAARAYTAALPHDPVSGAELRRRDEEQRGWGYHAGVLVARQGDEVLGTAAYFQNPGAYHPGRFILELGVAPVWQGQGWAGRSAWPWRRGSVGSAPNQRGSWRGMSTRWPRGS